MHFDPEFETCTYGDPSVKRHYLKKLERDDLLVFYAGLVPHENDVFSNGLYIIGYFTIDSVIHFNSFNGRKLEKMKMLCCRNAHAKRDDYQDLVIVKGIPDKSQLLEKAVLISERKSGKNGRYYHAVSKEMEALLGVSGSIQRSIPPGSSRMKMFTTLRKSLALKLEGSVA